MDKINIHILQNQSLNDISIENIKKIIQYAFTIIDNNLDSKYTNNYFNSNINIEPILYNDEYYLTNFDYKFNDCLFWFVPYESLIKIYENKDNISKYYLELEIIKKLPKFSKYILMIDNDNIEQNNSDTSFISYLHNIFDNKLDLCYININKALDYLSLIYDDIEIISVDLLDTVLRDEFGKQIFKKLDCVEKKQKQILQLTQKHEIVNEWIISTGIEAFVDVLQLNIVDNYSQIIKTHA